MGEDLQLIEVAPGRVVEVSDSGPRDGHPLVFHFGTPSVAARYDEFVEIAAARNLRTIVFSRPGYGDSTRFAGRLVADVVPDTVAVLDHLGLGDFLCLGWSGGGPHALACSCLLGDRCRATATIAGVAPWGVEGLDWLDGMGPENIEEFAAARRGEDVLRAWLETEAAGYLDVTAGQVADSLGGLVSDVDKASLTGGFAEFMAANLRRTVRTLDGWIDDDLAFLRWWGFELDDAGPTSIWQGAQDRMVPFAHGEWLAEHVEGSRSHLLEEHGHLSLAVGSIDAILDDLLDLAGIG